MEVKIINHSEYPMPHYASIDASGMDIRANILEPLIFESLTRQLIPTGIYLEIPSGYEIQIRPRSGLALKKGLTVLNAPGTIDADYRGEIKIILVNLSGETASIEPGERIAQMILSKIEKINLIPELELQQTIRAKGGFGSTGNQ